MKHHAFTALGFLALALAAGLWLLMTLELKSFVPPPLEEDSMLAKVLARPPAPSYIHIYAFHLTNHDKWIKDPKQKAALRELGPYVFRMDTIRSLDWSGETLSFKEKSTFHFEANLSTGTLNDTFTTVDLVTTSASYRGPTQFQNVSIRDYFFHGLTMSTSTNFDEWSLVDKDRHFAWFINLNGTFGPQFTVHTKPDFVNRIITINQTQTNLTGYEFMCSELTGKIAGFSLLPAFARSPETVTVYEPALCVPWTLRLQEQYILGYEPIARFLGDQTIFNATLKTCKSTRLTNINGTFDASPYYSRGIASKDTIPAVLSHPHYLYGDPTLHANITGLRPNKKKHSFYIDVHAPSGLVVDMRLRSQLNIKITPRKTPRKDVMIFPIFWQEISRLPGGKEKMVAAVTVWPIFAGWVAFACSLSLLVGALLIGAGILLQGPEKCWELEEEKRPNTPDDIPTDELSSEPEEDLRREQRRRALRARLPAGLPVYFKIHKGDLDNLGVDIPDWVLAKLQEQIDDQESTTSDEDSSDELPSPAGSPSWSTVSSRSTSPEQKTPKSDPGSKLSQSRASCPVLRSRGQEEAATPEQDEEEGPNGSRPPEDLEEEVQQEDSA